MFLLRKLALLLCGLLIAQAALADEAAIRKAFTERFPNLPPIDEITKSPIPGLYELRIGTDLVYSDEDGNYLIQGNLIETRTRNNLTEARITKLTAVDFKQLPFKDAITWKTGNGARRIAVFADPNCGYCKQFERDLQKIKNLTVHVFIIPVLGGDSPQKSENIWCSKDPAKAWLAWMLDNKEPVRNMGSCNTPLARNLDFARKHRITGTPASFFVNGARIAGAVGVDDIEKMLAAGTKPASAPSGATN